MGKTRHNATMWLVTGAAGYLGTSVCEKLDQSSIPYLGIDRITPDVENPRVYKFDIAEREKLRQLIKQNRFKGLIHLAALKDVAESMLDSEKYRYENVVLFQQLLFELKHEELKKIIYASSASVYGLRNGSISEEDETKPISVYGETKLAGEKILSDFALNSNPSKFALRIFNMAGTSGVSKQSTGVFAHLIEARNQSTVFRINGVNRDTQDGSAVRDYIGVKDVAEVILGLVQKQFQGTNYVLNVGRGKGTSILELIELFETEGDCKIRTAEAKKSEFDIDFSVAETTKLGLLLGDLKLQDISAIVNEEILMSDLKKSVNVKST